MFCRAAPSNSASAMFVSIRTKERHPQHIGRFVNASDVITADGFSRNVIVINEQFPGPTIDVMEGVQVYYVCGCVCVCMCFSGVLDERNFSVTNGVGDGKALCKLGLNVVLLRMANS